MTVSAINKPAMPGSASSAHPFVGLRPFNFHDHLFFFGRETHVTELYDRLSRNRFIAVVGGSGSGKSSLVRAGLQPLLAREMAEAGSRKWIFADFRPGDSPIRALATALAALDPRGKQDNDGGQLQALAERLDTELRRTSLGLANFVSGLMLSSDTILLLLVDQFEELFRFTDVREVTLHDDLERAERRDEAVAFVQLLLEAARVKGIPLRIVLTMRADFTGDCGRYLGLAEAVSAAQFLLPRLSRKQLEKVITGPVASAGGSIDHALVQRLLNDAGTDLDQLPILQHALMRTWDHATRRSGVTPPALELLDYEQIGGIDHALSQHADAAYAALVKEDPALEPVIEAVFKALTDVDREGRAVRCPRRLDRLWTIVVDRHEESAAANKRLRIVLESFRAHEMNFLMPPPEHVLDDRTVIDISHEALISHWRRLAGTPGIRGWVKEEARDGERYRALLELIPGPLTGRQVSRWNRWWRERHRTPGWAERYGGRFDDVSGMLRASRMRAGLVLSGTIVLGIFGLAFVLETWIYILERTAREAAEKNMAILTRANEQLEVSLKRLSPSQPTTEPSSQSPPNTPTSDANATVGSLYQVLMIMTGRPSLWSRWR